MANRVCWSCGTFTHMTAVGSTGGVVNVPRAGASRKQAAFTCDECSRMSIGEKVDSANISPGQVGPYLDRGVDTWLPARGASSEFVDVPEHIAGAATEATLCLSVGAYRAVGALARAVLEATAKHREAEGKDLYQRIEALHSADLIRKHTKEQAHEIRFFGNDMAHGDFADTVTKEEAEEIVELMCEVLDEVYQSPARLAARKAARIARAQSAG